MAVGFRVSQCGSAYPNPIEATQPFYWLTQGCPGLQPPEHPDGDRQMWLCLQVLKQEEVQHVHGTDPFCSRLTILQEWLGKKLVILAGLEEIQQVIQLLGTQVPGVWRHALGTVLNAPRQLSA